MPTRTPSTRRPSAAARPATSPLASPDAPRRIARLQRTLASRKLDAFLVFDRTNTFYLTGLRCSYSFLIVTPREAILFVDGRYIEAARATVAHCEVRLLKAAEQSLEAWGRAARPARVAFEGSAPWASVRQWTGWIGGEWEESDDILRAMRLIKSPAEIRAIEKSARLNDAVLAAVLGQLRPGLTERDVARMIAAEADRAGADRLSFETIVATGATSSRPHYSPAARPLSPGDLLLIDMGMVAAGYCSDMTRVVALGRKPKPRLVRAYEAVLASEQAALAAVAPGIACKDLDAIAREPLRKARLEKYFTHGLGHGVGLEIHEPPTLNPRSRDVLRPGMVITIEPGVYLPGLGGVRIEDLVLVTRNGHKTLSRSPKAFSVLPLE